MMPVLPMMPEFLSTLAPTGILLPESLLHSDFFAILAAFVAINTVMNAALAIAKIVPMVHLGDLIAGRRRRSETRSIHPETRPDSPVTPSPVTPSPVTPAVEVV